MEKRGTRNLKATFHCLILGILVLFPFIGQASAEENKGYPSIVLKLRDSIACVYKEDFQGAAQGILNSGINESPENREKKSEGLALYLKNVQETLCRFNGNPVSRDGGKVPKIEFVEDDGKQLACIFSYPHAQQNVYWAFRLIIEKSDDGSTVYQMKFIDSGDTAKDLLKSRQEKLTPP